MTVRSIAFAFLSFFCLSTYGQVPGSPIDVQHYTYSIELNDNDNTISCKADVVLKFLKNTASFNLDLAKKNASGKGMLVSAVTANEKAVAFSQSADKLTISAGGTAGNVYACTITYSGIPADGLIISTNKHGKRTFFGDNWPNRAHNWLVSVDHPVDKASVDFVVSAPSHYDVVANGLKVGETNLPQNKKQTHWRETAQLSTKIMVIGVADFAINHTGDVNGIPVYSYVFPQDSVKGVKSYAYAKEILPFFINKIGPYAYKKLANVQSKTMFGGMENAGAIFYFEDSPGDKGIEELMAHEIAHQWFGDAASEKNWQNVWLSEGFASYMTNYYLEIKYGSDSLKKRLLSQREKVFEFEKDRLTPVVDTTVKSDFMQLLNPNSYQKGGWVLHMLRRKLGDDVFWKGIRQYYTQYNGGNANTDDFRKAMEKASGKDLNVFFKQWLKTAGHPDLRIDWWFHKKTGAFSITINQKQKLLYSFPLEITIDGNPYTIAINERLTKREFKIKGDEINVRTDPNINLLATFTEEGIITD